LKKAHIFSENAKRENESSLLSNWIHILQLTTVKKFNTKAISRETFWN